MNVLSPEVNTVISLKRPPRGIQDGNGATIVHGVIPWSHMAFNIHNQTWHLPRMVMSRFIHYVINLSCNNVSDILFICHICKELHYIYIWIRGRMGGGGGCLHFLHWTTAGLKSLYVPLRVSYHIPYINLETHPKGERSRIQMAQYNNRESSVPPNQKNCY